jgi:bifunctional NMN adenylyltransferase/nudix hydrolase
MKETVRDRAKQTIGVIVGRFQVPDLHAGHRHLIETALQENDAIHIVLGCTAGFPDDRDPLSAEVRAEMIQQEYPGISTSTITDVHNAQLWSQILDGKLRKLFSEQTVRLYGSRGSFGKVYTGTYPFTYVDHVPNVSGTKLRLTALCRNSNEYRLGLIHSQQARSPIPYGTVDLAVIHPNTGMILVGSKEADGERKRFVGGFLDVTDESDETAALREFSEEVPGVAVKDITYVMSCKGDDLRYRGRKDGTITRLFLANYVSGDLVAGDDLHSVEWVSLDNLEECLIDTHKPLAIGLKKFLERNKND